MMKLDEQKLWLRCLRAVSAVLILTLGILLALMCVSDPAQAEGVTFRFPDTELPWVPGEENVLPDRQGEVQVSGALMAVPCVMQGERGPDGQLRLALSGCGDGLPDRGLAPVAASLRWSENMTPRALRLYSGVTLPLPSLRTAGLAPEVSYE